MIIRYAKEEDAKELLDIYAYYVTNTAITFEYDVPTLLEFKNRIKHTLENYPWIVAIDNNEIIGYAYTSPLKERAAYQYSVETSIYVKHGLLKSGVGKALYSKLEEISLKQNIQNMYACIAYNDIDDEYLTKNSVQFHTHLGYRLIGTFKKCGYKFNRYYDMVWMEKEIAPHKVDATPFIPFSKLVF